ncbi:MAG: hypothetical protein WBB45_01245 [Cyclobacteriaceae bacterium]
MVDDFDEIENKKEKKVTSPLDPLLEKVAIAFVLLVFLIIFAKTVFL